MIENMFPDMVCNCPIVMATLQINKVAKSFSGIISSAWGYLVSGCYLGSKQKQVCYMKPAYLYVYYVHELIIHLHSQIVDLFGLFIVTYLLFSFYYKKH